MRCFESMSWLFWRLRPHVSSYCNCVMWSRQCWRMYCESKLNQMKGQKCLELPTQSNQVPLTDGWTGRVGKHPFTKRCREGNKKWLNNKRWLQWDIEHVKGWVCGQQTYDRFINEYFVQGKLWLAYREHRGIGMWGVYNLYINLTAPWYAESSKLRNSCK